MELVKDSFMTLGLHIALLLIGSYLFGSLPFGLWIAWKWKGVDIRTVGSGNIGSTNVSRVCGPAAGVVVLILDVLKGLLPPLVGRYFHLPSQWLILAALLAIIGHNYSIFLGFKGGKGIATSAGALFGVSWQVGIGAAGTFGLVFLLFRYVSLGSIAAALSLPPLMWYFYPGDYYRLAFSIVACVMAVYKHRANIQRLREGTEPKVGRKDA
ncbi:MAG: acyl-phosphate glycerol-3-phosphate acyltransferase [Chthonomonadaceae bacterium]|nr:acyl-phosphate glycerol-3-phosphate acyltransferase [Chthonomonadaceae bacterium]